MRVSVIIGLSNRMVPSHRCIVLTQEWCWMNFPSFIDKDHWLPNSPNLNPLDYSIWDEFAQQINWAKVKSKKTLIDELKRSVKRIRDSVVLESCERWMKTLAWKVKETIKDAE